MSQRRRHGRPDRLVLVVGTGTEVGKTWLAARLIAALRDAGSAVAARKPTQSFEPGRGPTDAALLAGASGEAEEVVCPPAHAYPVAMAPPMAAEVLGRPPVTLDDLVAALAWPHPWPPGRPTVGVVEGAGGVRSPLAADGDGADLARRLAPDVLALVADAGLGTIHAVRTSAAALGWSPGARSRAAPGLVVVLNRFDQGVDLHRRNREWLADRDGFDVVVDPADLVDRAFD
ncbi:MAG TPA: dethiobiotin synthase [Acidimicrobiales bacterium]|nr:dethiobiotin synthase [Acidimicrobiales bacterium]